MDYFYEGIHRLDWGFGNPNMTAALIAMLAVAACGVALVWRKLFWFAIPVTTGLMIALIHTLSRGGLVAFLLGAIALVIAVRPRLNRKRIITLACLTLMLVGYAHHLGGAARYVQGINGVEDRSLGNRWLIYRSVPRMLLDAPGGWGKGNAAETYHQWYQPEGRSESYLNLVNSHFTWLVEWPTWARLLYFIGWAFVILGLWPDARHRWWGIVLAVWMTLFIASCFSSVAHRPWIWPFPVALLLMVAIQRLVTRQGLSGKQMLLAASAPVGAYLAILLIAWLSRDDVRIQHRGGATTVGSTTSQRKIALCGSDSRILGERYGHRIRGYARSHPESTIAFLTSPDTLDAKYQTVVLVGNAHEQFQASPASRLLMLNPSGPEESMNLQDHKSVKVLWGAFNSSPDWYAWQAKAAQSQAFELVKLPGEGMFLENWLDLL